MKEERPIKPYARLLTMLSEQLIKNESVALTEIIKNAYDADSKLVKVTFEGFSDKFVANKESCIIIEDRGNGMTEAVLIDDFVNPASANKKIKKEKGETTGSGRKLQGEKGIGRFSLFKLGKKVTVITKTKGDTASRKLIFDFSNYPDQFIHEDGTQVSLDEVRCDFYSEDSYLFNQPLISDENYTMEIGSGTQIMIENLNDKWGESKVNKVAEELNSLVGENRIDNFAVFIFQDNSFIPSRKLLLDDKKLFEKLLAQKAVYSFGGGYTESEKSFTYYPLKSDYNQQEDKYTLSEDTRDERKITFTDISGLSLFKDYFIGDKSDRQFSSIEEIKTSCGDFSFKFFIFDPVEDARGKFKLDRETREWDIIKDNRVYIFRDNVRVFPYGSVKDDWLQVDTIRGTKRANAMFSNDQLVGYVYITHEGNPLLADKTNREGIIEKDSAFEDFVALNQVFLQYLNRKYYQDYKDQKDKIKKFNKQAKDELDKEFEEVLKSTETDKKLNTKLKEIRKRVFEQDNDNKARIKVVENLAATGLSIEATNHDMHHFIRKLCNILDNMRKKIDATTSLDKEYISEEVYKMRGVVADMESFIGDMKSLFTSTNQKIVSLRFNDVISKVFKYYAFIFEQKKIGFEIKNISDKPLVVNMPEAQLVAILINILDNAQYWLENYRSKDKMIKITIDSEEETVLISDNGPGIYDGEEEKIFQAFWTGKGKEGRGLGLYICQQFLERYDYSIVVDRSNKYRLSGANFLLSFTTDEV